MLKEYKINENLKEADVGYVVQAIGPVVDVRFDDGLTPSLRFLKIWDMLQSAVSPWELLKELKKV